MGKAPTATAVVCRDNFEERVFVYPVYETLGKTNTEVFPYLFKGCLSLLP